jgi:hypothetical protein
MNCLRFLIIAVLAFLFSLGCTGSNVPTDPGTDVDFNRSSLGLAPAAGFSSGDSSLSYGSMLSSDYLAGDNGGHEIMAIYRMTLFDDGSYEVFQDRNAEAHFNVTSIVLNCPTCFKITLGPPPGPNTFDFNVTLTNPTAIKGFDVTGIIRWSGDITFHNPDSYTFLFNHPGDTSPNPYVAWDTGVGNREFPGSGPYTETVRLEKGGLTKFTEIDFIFQASYPSNQEEPYAIFGLSSQNNLQSDGSNTSTLRCRVGDWQNNVDSVFIDLTAVGGPMNTPMTHTTENIYEVLNVKYNPTGQGPGVHNLKITATSAGVQTFNFLPVTVISSGPITDGSFLVEYQNLPLGHPNGPVDGMDISVIGAQDGSSASMVFGDDDTYHFWNSDYSDGTFGLYYADSGQPITPFDLPNFRFDFADQVIPDTSVDSLFELSWGEANQSPDILDGSTIPKIMSDYRIALWDLNAGNLSLSANVLVLGADPGPPVTYDVIVRPVEIASGLRGDGLLYIAMVFAAGSEANFPVVDFMAWKPPLSFSGNPNMISGGYEMAVDDASGPGTINRDALVGFDVDDSGILEITGGFAGHTTIAAVEKAPENALEIIDYDIDAGSGDFITVPLTSEPLDVEIIPLTEAGFAANWIAVLCKDGKIRLYNYLGTLVQTIGGSPYMTGTPLRLDVDDENLAIHVLHQGTSSTLVTVYKWNG